MGQERLIKLLGFREHPWLGRVFVRLSKADLAFMESFCVENAALGKDDFEKRVNRMFLDRERPKNWKLILELLANCNTL